MRIMIVVLLNIARRSRDIGPIVRRAQIAKRMMVMVQPVRVLGGGSSSECGDCLLQGGVLWIWPSSCRVVVVCEAFHAACVWLPSRGTRDGRVSMTRRKSWFMPEIELAANLSGESAGMSVEGKRYKGAYKGTEQVEQRLVGITSKPCIMATAAPQWQTTLRDRMEQRQQDDLVYARIIAQCTRHARQRSSHV